VEVCNGGIEMGKGIKKKVEKVVENKMKIDLEIVRVKKRKNMKDKNGMVSGGRIESEDCDYDEMM
jgi:xanthine dehydrogenase molybdopterin-binding subunit B